jgi:hypothetical protein
MRLAVRCGIRGQLSDRAAFQIIDNKLTVAFEALKRL